MFARFRPRLTYANVVSTLCLFILLGGSAVAASGLLTGKDIKNRSIPGKKLKPDTVTGKEVKESTLAQVPSANNANTLQGHPPAKGFQSYRDLVDTLPSSATRVDSLAVPAASYLVTAKLTAVNTDATPHRVNCNLTNDLTGDGDRADVEAPPYVANNGRSTVVLEAAARMPASGHWNVRCWDPEVSGTIGLDFIRIQAIQVSSLSNTASP